jgi:ubiquinone/menaquinone biosynthesis C-methylase UbiE
MPDNDEFIGSPELYDAIYSFKNYRRECTRLHNLINALVPGAQGILDVACGTGEHAKYLKEHYSVDGIDINEGYLRAARLKNPSGKYTQADLMNFDLGRTYDVVTCLFSAIGIVKTFTFLETGITCMARHVRPGGALIIEPWFTPELWRPTAPFILVGELETSKVYRLSQSVKEGPLSLLLHHYLKATPNGIEHYSEKIELGLFSRDEMTWAFDFAGMAVQYDAEGLMGRGLYVGRHDPVFSSGVAKAEIAGRGAC